LAVYRLTRLTRLQLVVTRKPLLAIAAPVSLREFKLEGPVAIPALGGMLAALPHLDSLDLEDTYSKNFIGTQDVLVIPPSASTLRYSHYSGILYGKGG